MATPAYNPMGGVNPNATPINGVNYDGFNSPLLKPTINDSSQFNANYNGNNFVGQGLLGLAQQSVGNGGNPNAMPNTQAFSQMQSGAQNNSYQAQNAGTTDAQVATQPQMNTGNVGQYDNFLNNLYQTNLGRTADQPGMQYWQSQLASGMSPESVIQNFQSSPEYQANQALQSANKTTGANPFGITNQSSLQNSADPYIQAAQQTTLGNLSGATAATAANRVNQSTPYANLQYQQTGTDANGNPIWSANQSLNPQLQAAMSGLQNKLASTAGQGVNTNTLAQTGINPGELYSDAIMRRLQPQLQQQQASVETRLANQGIMPGSEAYNRAKTQLAQQQNDALTSAQVQGMDVGLRANQQGFNQQLQQSNLPIAQLGAFNQATQPGYVNPYNQAAVAGPDYTGAYTTGQAAAIAAQNAANAKTAGLQSGLYNLGSSALLSSGGLTGLANLGKQGYDWLSGLGGSNYTGPSYGVNPDFSNNVFDYLSFD